MTKKQELPELRPEALTYDNPSLVEAVKEWVSAAGDVDPEAMLRELNKTVIEQVLETEMDHHLGYRKHWPTIAARLKLVYHATSADEDAQILDELEQDWGHKYPA